MAAKQRVFSGIQPSGRLHIGNYVGAMKNMISLQDEYSCIYAIVDYHAMTVHFDPKEMEQSIFACAVDYLAAGIDPSRSVLVVQSTVPGHTELAWILNTVTPISWLLRVPTFKEKRKQNPDYVNMGLLDYPVLMAADIVLYRAEVVPVGDDQLPHLELTREIVRRFNGLFGPTFLEPKARLGPVSRILGLDGANKMSKSLDNCVYLDDTEEVMWKKLSTAVTDVRRKRRTDPGDPDECNIFTMHKAFSPAADIEQCGRECRVAGIGCLDCKKILLGNIRKELGPIQERAARLRNDRERVLQILKDGQRRAVEIAAQTMADVHAKLGIGLYH